MRILIVSASVIEIKKLLSFTSAVKKFDDTFIAEYKSNKITFLITGIGLTTTAYKFTKAILNNNFDLVINVGIAGSFNSNINIGDIVNVISEQFGDLGIDNNNEFVTLFDENLLKDEFPYSDKKLININKTDFFSNLPKVSGISVNTISGSKKIIEKRISIFNADIETMEGAAIFYIALQEKINFLEIRAISNYVEPRNKENWDIKLAILNLNNKIIDFINE